MSRRKAPPPRKSRLSDYALALAMIVVPILLLLLFASGAWNAIVSGIQHGPAPAAGNSTPVASFYNPLAGDCTQTQASPFTLECTSVTPSPSAPGQ